MHFAHVLAIIGAMATPINPAESPAVSEASNGPIVVAGAGSIGCFVGGLLADLLFVTDPPGLPTVAMAATVVLLGVVGFTRAEPRAGFITWSVTCFGIAYVGLLTPFLALTGHDTHDGTAQDGADDTDDRQMEAAR